MRQALLDRNNAYRERNRNFVIQYQLEHPCVDCGEKDPIVLEFDHQDGKKIRRRDGMSFLVYRNASLARLKQEMDKCIVRCANCHRRRTAKQQNWWKFRVAQAAKTASEVVPALPLPSTANIAA